MTFRSILDEIENNLKKILSDLSISKVDFSVEPANLVLVMLVPMSPSFGKATRKSPKKLQK